MERRLLTVAVGMLVAMFVPSALHKVLSLGRDGGTDLLLKAYPVMKRKQSLVRCAVFAAGVFELIALAAIIHGWTTRTTLTLGLGALGLICFTAAVTLLVWTRPYNEVMALHNLSAIGGLLLLFLMRHAVIA